MRLSWAAEITKTTQDAVTKTATNFCESSPAGMARMAVRGLAASICASARRLKAMAAERADTMHRTIQPSCANEGTPPAASMAAHRANGRAKTECSHLIISSVIPMLLRIRKDYSKPTTETPRPGENQNPLPQRSRMKPRGQRENSGIKLDAQEKQRKTSRRGPGLVSYA